MDRSYPNAIEANLDFQRASSASFERVGTEKTHCKPFDLVKTEQWVFGYTLCVYPNRLDYTQFTVMPYWSNFRGRISSK